MSRSPTDVQVGILEFLADRAVSSDRRYCTLTTARNAVGFEGHPQYFRTLADDLEIRGLINTRQKYQVSGGRLFQISAKGLELVRNGGAMRAIQSARWTGHYEVSATGKAKISETLIQLRVQIECADLTNSDRANCLGLVAAAQALVDMEDTPWPIFLQILDSPSFNRIATITSLVASIIAIVTL